MNKVATELYKKLDIKGTHTAPAHPQCNSQAEVFNKTLAKYMKNSGGREHPQLGMVPSAIDVLLQHLLPQDNPDIAIRIDIWHETKITFTSKSRIL